MKRFSKILSIIMCLVMLMGTSSVLFIGAQAATAPSFSLEEKSKDGTTVVYELKLTNGGFNALDFDFVMSSGVTCTSIVFANGVSGGVANAKNGSVSYANTQTYSTSGTIVTATFTVPSDSYTIGVNVTNCTVCEGTDNIDVTSGVSVGNGDVSFFVKIIRAIIAFFQLIASLFTGAAA